MISAKFTPKFNVQEIFSEWIQKDWYEFQYQVQELGNEMLTYMQGYINTSRKRPSEATGNLNNSIKLYPFGGFGMAEIGWGIGDMSIMSKLAPYWYLINFGGSSFKGNYHFTPGFFDGGVFKYNPMIAEGKILPSGVKGVIKPMNYIDASQVQLNNRINIIINNIKNAG